MIVIVGGRASGKSEVVLRWLMEQPDYRGIVVLDQQRKDHLLQRLHDHLPHYPWKHHIFTIYDMVNMRGYGSHFGQAHGPYREMAIDDTEQVLTRLFGAQVEFAAMNGTYIPLGPVSRDPIKADATIVPQIQPVVPRRNGKNEERLRIVKGGLDGHS